MRPFPQDDEVLILDTDGLQERFGLPNRKRDQGVHFKGEENQKENYTMPLGCANVPSLPNRLIEVTRKCP